MKTIIDTKDFFRISLLTITLAGTSMFAVKFEEPELYKTKLRGSLLRRIKTIRYRNLLNMPLEAMEKTREDIKKAVPKLSDKEIDKVISSRDLIEFQSDERNKLSQLIDDSHKKRKLLKEALEKIQPDYKKDAKLNPGLAQKYGNEINRLKKEIETKRQLRLGHIDQKLLNLAQKINNIFESKGYKSIKRNDENFFWIKTIYKKEPKETKEKYEEKKEQLQPEKTKQLKRQLRLR